MRGGGLAVSEYRRGFLEAAALVSTTGAGGSEARRFGGFGVGRRGEGFVFIVWGCLLCMISSLRCFFFFLSFLLGLYCDKISTGKLGKLCNIYADKNIDNKKK